MEIEGLTKWLGEPAQPGATVTINGKNHATPSLRHPLTAKSPLWMLTKEPILNDLVIKLQGVRLALQKSPEQAIEIEFSRAYLEQVRQAFAKMILSGEETLHRLSQLLCHTLLLSYQMHSVVIGEVSRTKERFTVTQGLSANDLCSTTDIDLGTRQLNKLRFFDGQDWSTPNLIANMVEYQPTETNPYAIHKIISRIKAEEEIWNKVVDEIFDLDSIVVRDKKLRHLSRYVKDVFGLKVIVGELSDIHQVQAELMELTWPDEMLQRFGIEPNQSTRQLTVTEVKDYTQLGQRKNSGWEAMKSVIHWSNKMFEIQIQPLANFMREREFLTKESHVSFKANRERVRNQVAQQIPLFGFYQKLLQWLFLTPTAPAPVHNKIILLLVD